jgi:hypothetical protein
MATSIWSATKFGVPKRVWYLIFSIYAVIIFNSCSYGQSTKNQLTKFELSSLTTNYSNSYLSSVFDKKITDAVQIVGLGEVSHGGYEPFAFKANMVKYLIENKGYRKFLIETDDFGPIRTLRKYLDDETITDTAYATQWVKNGGFPDATLAVWPGLFKWIKQYNIDHPKNKVEVMGLDVSEGDNTINFILTKYIIPYNYKESQQFAPLLPSAVPLNKWLTSNQPALKAKLSKDDFYWLSFYIRNALNSFNYYQKKLENDTDKSDAANLFRDSIMSENVKYLIGNDKSIIWAHNGHIVRADNKFMGTYMNQYYKSKYYAIATDFSKYAAVEVYHPDSMQVAHKRYPTKIFRSGATTSAYNILDKHGISEGIFFPQDLADMNIKQDVNIIDVGGLTFHFQQYHNLFDALVVFSMIYPTPK